MKKILQILALLLILSSVQAIQFGNEIETPEIASGSFKMMTEPQLDSRTFIQFQLVDVNGTGLENYHTELKIYDNRGVLVYPNPYLFLPSQEGLDLELAIHDSTGTYTDIAFSDSNGTVNYLVQLNSCNALINSGCFILDQNYTVVITGKNIYREETFVTRLKEIRTNWIGDSLRFVYKNTEPILILFLAGLVLVYVIGTIFSRKRGK